MSTRVCSSCVALVSDADGAMAEGFAKCPVCVKDVPMRMMSIHLDSSSCYPAPEGGKQCASPAESSPGGQGVAISWKERTFAGATERKPSANSASPSRPNDNHERHPCTSPTENGRCGIMPAHDAADDGISPAKAAHSTSEERTLKRQRVHWAKKMRMRDDSSAQYKVKQHTSKAASSASNLVSWSRLPKPGNAWPGGTSYLHGNFVVEDFVTEEEEREIINGLWHDESIHPFAWQSKGIGAQMWGKTYGTQILYGRNQLEAPKHPMPDFLTRAVIPRLKTLMPGLTDNYTPTECSALLYIRGKSWLKPHVDDRSLSTDIICNLSILGDAVVRSSAKCESKSNTLYTNDVDAGALADVIFEGARSASYCPSSFATQKHSSASWASAL